MYCLKTLFLFFLVGNCPITNDTFFYVWEAGRGRHPLIPSFMYPKGFKASLGEIFDRRSRPEKIVYTNNINHYE